MPLGSLVGLALSVVFAVAFGGAFGLVAGLFVLPFALSARVRAAVERGPTPEVLPNALLLSAVGGMLFAAVHFGLAWADGHGLLAVSRRETLTVVAGGATALLAATFLFARGYEARADGAVETVGPVGVSLLVAAGTSYGALVTLFSFVR